MKNLNDISLKVDLIIKDIVVTIEKDSGWKFVDNNRFIFKDNFKKNYSFDEDEHDTFSVIRGTKGFHPYTEDASNGYLWYIRNVEVEFFENYKSLLVILDTCLKEKEKMFEKEEGKKVIRKKLMKPNTNH